MVVGGVLADVPDPFQHKAVVQVVPEQTEEHPHYKACQIQGNVQILDESLVCLQERQKFVKHGSIARAIHLREAFHKLGCLQRGEDPHEQCREIADQQDQAGKQCHRPHFAVGKVQMREQHAAQIQRGLAPRVAETAEQRHIVQRVGADEACHIAQRLLFDRFVRRKAAAGVIRLKGDRLTIRQRDAHVLGVPRAFCGGQRTIAGLADLGIREIDVLAVGADHAAAPHAAFLLDRRPAAADGVQRRIDAFSLSFPAGAVIGRAAIRADDDILVIGKCILANDTLTAGIFSHDLPPIWYINFLIDYNTTFPKILQGICGIFNKRTQIVHPAFCKAMQINFKKADSKGGGLWVGQLCMELTMKDDKIDLRVQSRSGLTF